MSEPTTNGPAQILAQEIDAAGGPAELDPRDAGAIGRTMFDLPGSTDLTVTVLLPNDHLHAAPAQALVRILSKRDDRRYLGVVSAGPFAEPDGLKADSPLLVAVSTHGSAYLPPYHGRIQVTILGEELSDGTLTPPRLRPVPNSPVFVLSDAESAELLKCGGDIRLGLAAGHEAVEVGVPSDKKSVLPRHTAILGTTGGGKSNTVAGLVKRAINAGMAVILIDVEGEYTHLHEPTADARMLAALAERGLHPEGIPVDRMFLYHLTGRDTANPNHPQRREFSLQFAQLSPYTVFEILNLSEAQQERFLKAYDIAKEVMRDVGIFPVNAEQERIALEVDEFERGYPRMTLPILMDIVGACLARADSGSKRDRRDGDAEPTFTLRSRAMNTPKGIESIKKRVYAANPPGHAVSWRVLLSRLTRLARLGVFYDEAGGVSPINYKRLLEPGRLSVIDLSDTGYSELNNLVIADLLRGVQTAQDELCQRAEEGGNSPPRVLIVIEEAHEFLSAERIEAMPVLHRQVERIAKRGRKRWLGLCFVTQLPAHMPRQILGLCNSFILHKLTDPQVVAMLRRTVSGMDDGLWERLSGLAPGQAVVSFPHMTQPLLVSIDPAPGKLRMAD